MTNEELFHTLKAQFAAVLKAQGIENDRVEIRCRALSTTEAIGTPKRTDYPIISGKDVMVQAEYRGSRGQAFTDAPTAFEGTLYEILQMDLAEDPRGRGLFIAAMNAVMSHLGLCKGTVHCRTEGPELCALEMRRYLSKHYPERRRIGLVGYQPALLAMLAQSEYEVRVLDLNPDNIGQVRCGVPVESGVTAREDLIRWADLILCTGSALCNGTIVDYLELETEVLFFGITLAGGASLLGLKRVCFADQYE